MVGSQFRPYFTSCRILQIVVAPLPSCTGSWHQYHLLPRHGRSLRSLTKGPKESTHHDSEMEEIAEDDAFSFSSSWCRTLSLRSICRAWQKNEVLLVINLLLTELSIQFYGISIVIILYVIYIYTHSIIIQLLSYRIKSLNILIYYYCYYYHYCYCYLSLLSCVYVSTKICWSVLESANLQCSKLSMFTHEARLTTEAVATLGLGATRVGDEKVSAVQPCPQLKVIRIRQDQ